MSVLLVLLACDPDPYSSDTAAIAFADEDADGFGDLDSGVVTCTRPENEALYVPRGEDCDDNGCPVEHCGTISSDETWSASASHTVTCELYVQGSGSPVLTIEDGVTVEIEAGYGIRIGNGSAGALHADGSTSGIVFTSAESSPAAGDWDGLYLGDALVDADSAITGITVEYGGYDGYGGIRIGNNSIEISDSDIHDNEASGIYISSNVTPVITGSTIEDNTEDGLYVLGSLGGDSEFTSNTVTGNGGYALKIYPNKVYNLDSSSSYSGNTEGGIYVWGGNMTASVTWQALDDSYYVSDYVDVQDGSTNTTGTGSPHLTIEDGVEILFAENASSASGPMTASTPTAPSTSTAAPPGSPSPLRSLHRQPGTGRGSTSARATAAATPRSPA